ncbi:MAG: T9SS type A sorting domain-containing protein [Crocinitomicaceae bacterium]|nr:T9SS type A sorting domain-containing protein [Crocinitomicaceae bacterium]
MKKIYFLALGALFTNAVNAQTMNENFDGYTAGTYMGNNSALWSTWSGTTGGAEDVQVTTANANSGSNSIYFSSTTQAGGPQDVIVDFQGVYNYGHFNWSSMFFVESGKGAYFNFQGQSTPGQSWTLNCQMDHNGNIQIDDSYAIWVDGTYPQNTWFELEFDIDLNNDFWEVFINGVSQGKFQNETNQLATMDIYPVNNSDNGGNNVAGFYMDDFQYTYTPYSLPTLNGAVTYIGDFHNVAGPPDVAGVVGSAFSPVVTVRNLGTTTITSFDLEIAHNGATVLESITGVSIPSLGEYEYEFVGEVILTSGSNDVSVTISNVNGGTDDDAADDTKSLPVDPITPATGKVVYVEEGTGTWCQWCPRGAVMMDRMQKLYPDLFAGVAVHNNDPMEDVVFDAGVDALTAGYPSALVERGGDIDPSQIESQFLQHVVVAPTAFITVGASYDSGNGILSASVTADFQSTVSGQWKLACIISEDSVTGSGSGWSQSNAYSGGGSGPMGGFESLPSTVPASQMNYNHVGRRILPDFNGHENSFPTTNSGDVHTVDFIFQLDPNWDVDQIHIIGILVAPGGTVDNAGKASIAEAEANGYVSSTEVIDEFAGFVELSDIGEISLYPNPSTGISNLTLPNVDNETVILNVFNMEGKIIASRNYGELSGAQILPIITSQYDAGIYTVQVIVGDKQEIRKLIVE